jgi:hypothetical protein
LVSIGSTLQAKITVEAIPARVGMLVMAVV